MSNESCEVQGCTNARTYRHYCKRHYKHVAQYGAPQVDTAQGRAPLRRRLWAKVVMQPDGCWVWTGLTNRAGYGCISHNKAMWLVHRFVYERLIGRIPDGLVIDHLCRVPACCNPRHLEPVTDRINFLRGQHPHALAFHAGKCVRGHERTPGKKCRECHTLSQRERRRQQREAACR